MKFFFQFILQLHLKCVSLFRNLKLTKLKKQTKINCIQIVYKLIYIARYVNFTAPLGAFILSMVAFIG